MGKKRVFSGIQPSGRLHIGNYLGAIHQFVRMVDDYECIFGVVNYHALTSLHDGPQLRENTVNVVIDYLACGLDPERCIIMVQADVPQHTELSWLLSTVTPVPWLERCPTYKDKKLQQAKDVNFGLMSYPVLMAADILIYKSGAVPVGKDQLPHLELCREMVRAFNHRYGETFPEPESLVNEETAVILGTDGQKKMSKSAGNIIEMFLEPEEMKKVVMTMVTDPQKIRKGDPGRPDVCNVFSLHGVFSTEQVHETRAGCESGKLGCVECKGILAATMAKFFRPMREKRRQLVEQPGYVGDVLATGAAKAREIAEQTMAEVREKMGLALGL